MPGEPVGEQVEPPVGCGRPGEGGEQGAQGKASESAVDGHAVLPVMLLWPPRAASCHDRSESITTVRTGTIADRYAAAAFRAPTL
ncbi:hypothetical protein Are01nite_04650 [Actinoplanes regularis]|nr:hypothetical protein Are01nite_04650 [Actinoplanes regularis]